MTSSARRSGTVDVFAENKFIVYPYFDGIVRTERQEVILIPVRFKVGQSIASDIVFGNI